VPGLEVSIDPAAKRVLVRRLGTPLRSAEEAAGLLGELRDAVAGIDPKNHTVLVDLRPAHIRDETLYRDPLRALRRALVLGFQKTAFLVQTKVGQLQVTRYLQEEGLVAPVFLDEASALAHLTT
jgi:hypothetical protein